MRRPRIPLVCGLLTVACVAEAPHGPGPPPEDDPVYELLEVARDAGYPQWAVLGDGGAVPTPGNGPHGPYVIIYVSPDLLAAATGPVLDPEQWPPGAMTVCEGYDDPAAEPALVQVARRDADGWNWAQYDDRDRALALGRPGTCTGCHAGGADYLYGLPFPEPPEE